MMTPDEFKKAATEQANTWYKFGCDHYRIEPNKFDVTFYRSKGRQAGLANMSGWVDYNMDMALQSEENLATFFREIIPHEIAHLINFRVYPNAKQGHGPEFKRVLDVFGIAQYGIYHSMPVKRSNARYYIYQCPCRYHQVSARKHNKIIKSATYYVCKSCEERITFIREDKE